MNRRRLLQTAAAALLAPAAARTLPSVTAAPVVSAGDLTVALTADTTAMSALPRFAAGRGAIRFATPPALSASGGLCAPASPYYPLLELTADEGPILDALTTRAHD